jgi:hypothetical protein
MSDGLKRPPVPATTYVGGGFVEVQLAAFGANRLPRRSSFPARGDFIVGKLCGEMPLLVGGISPAVTRASRAALFGLIAEQWPGQLSPPSASMTWWTTRACQMASRFACDIRGSVFNERSERLATEKRLGESAASGKPLARSTPSINDKNQYGPAWQFRSVRFTIEDRSCYTGSGKFEVSTERKPVRSCILSRHQPFSPFRSNEFPCSKKRGELGTGGKGMGRNRMDHGERPLSRQPEADDRPGAFTNRRVPNVGAAHDRQI